MIATFLQSKAAYRDLNKRLGKLLGLFYSGCSRQPLVFYMSIMILLCTVFVILGQYPFTDKNLCTAQGFIVHLSSGVPFYTAAQVSVQNSVRNKV